MKIKMSATIEDLPDPIIEYILSYLSPYRDLKQCMQVNRAWYRYVYGKYFNIFLIPFYMHTVLKSFNLKICTVRFRRNTGNHCLHFITFDYKIEVIITPLIS